MTDPRHTQAEMLDDENDANMGEILAASNQRANQRMPAADVVSEPPITRATHTTVEVTVDRSFTPAQPLPPPPTPPAVDVANTVASGKVRPVMTVNTLIWIIATVGMLLIVTMNANDPNAPWYTSASPQGTADVAPQDRGSGAADPVATVDAQPTAATVAAVDTNTAACIPVGASLYWDKGTTLADVSQTEQACTVVANEGTWVRVQLAGGGTVWVLRSEMGAQFTLPEPTAAPVAAPVAPQAPPAQQECVNPGDGHWFCAATYEEADRQAKEYILSGQMQKNQQANP